MSARVFVVADGLGGAFLAHESDYRSERAEDSRLGAGVIVDDDLATIEPGTIYMASGPGGYVGLVRLEDGRVDVAAAFDPGFVRQTGGPGRAAETLLSEAGLPSLPGLADRAWRGTPLLTRHVCRPAAYRAFVLGDAAGYVEPFTGEGIAWALAAGVAVAPLAQRACRHWDHRLAVQWSVRYRQTVARRQRVCRIVARALRQPGLVTAAVSLLQRVPVLAAPLVRYLNVTWIPKEITS